MKIFIKTNWKSLIFFAIIGAVGGFFTGIYLLEGYPAKIQEQMMAQGVNATLMGVVTAVQSAIYGFVLGGFGILFGKKVGLWKEEKSLNTKPLIIAIVAGIVGGLAMILSDIVLFGRYSEAIMESYAKKPTILQVLASVAYGAVIEEVMLRLFAMSLVAFVLHMLFQKKKKNVSAGIMVVANLITAMIFAAGHLPATFMILGNSSIIILRCFLLNGGLGLVFGYLYRKYGLRYAMIAHGGCHIISKLIWMLFI